MYNNILIVLVLTFNCHNVLDLDLEEHQNGKLLFQNIYHNSLFFNAFTYYLLTKKLNLIYLLVVRLRKIFYVIIMIIKYIVNI